MNKLILSFLFWLLIITSTAAQRNKLFGIRAGGNFSRIAFQTKNGTSLKGERDQIGFHAGIMADIPVLPKLYLQPSVLFSVKGTKLVNEAYEYFWKADYTNADYIKITTNNIDIPISLVLKQPLGSGKLILGAGGFLSYALSGFWEENINYELDYGNLELIEDLSSKSADTTAIYWKKKDYGANFVAGYEFSRRFSIQINKQFGFVNLVPDNNGQKPEDTWKSRSLSISALFKF